MFNPEMKKCDPLVLAFCHVNNIDLDSLSEDEMATKFAQWVDAKFDKEQQILSFMAGFDGCPFIEEEDDIESYKFGSGLAKQLKTEWEHLVTTEERNEEPLSYSG